jgi:predicted hydrocarbon binding protein
MRMLNSRGGLLETVQATLEMTDIGRSVREAKGLSNVDILFDMGIEEGGINVQMAELEVHTCRNGEKLSQASHYDDGGERLCVVESGALAAALSNKASLVTGYIPIKV